MAVVAVLFVLLGMVATVGAQSRRQACESCHRPQATNLAASAHSSVSCLECHLSNGAWSYPSFATDRLPRMMLGKTTNTSDGDSVPTSDRACARCHKSALGKGVITTARGLRIRHDTCTAQAASCAQCHAKTAHADAVSNPRGPVMEDCVACHKERGASRKCETCHAGKIDREQQAKGPFAVTHGPNWKQTHGLGRLDTCQTCHEPNSCQKCHGVEVPHPDDFGRTHGATAKKDVSKCQTCHKDTKFCSNCHGIQMPHAAGYLKNHSKIAASVNDKRCSRCHEPADCSRCHQRHVHPGGSNGVPVRHPKPVPQSQTPTLKLKPGLQPVPSDSTPESGTK